MMYLPVELVDLDRSKGFVSMGSASGFNLKNRWLRESRREGERERTTISSCSGTSLATRSLREVEA